MSTAIVGMGLVTPFGRTPAENVFFLRAGVPAPPPSPFETRDGDRVDVNYCRWIGAAMPLAQRVLALGERALGHALAAAFPAAAAVPARDTRVMLCLPKARAGFDDDDGAALEQAAQRAGAVHRFHGEAGAFLALREGADALAKGARAVVVLAADSMISLPAIERSVRQPPSEWGLTALRPSEGAAALVLMDAQRARRDGVAVLGSVDGAAVAAGVSNDDNDDPVDGTAMTTALKQLPADRRARSAFGQWRVDLLRRHEWQLASARLSERFAQSSVFACLESRVGRLGAAAGLANAVYGAAMLRHRACERADASDAPLYAWALSPDGTRGVAMLRAEGR
jgi:hypothetical protein